MTAHRIQDAAAELGVSPSTLRRWLARGAPVARRGRRGRGGSALIDVAAVRAWRGTGASTDLLQTFAAELPELVAAAVDDSFRAIEAPRKHELAGVLAAVWFEVVSQVLEHLRRDVPDLPEPSTIPESIVRLREIGRR